MQDCQISLIFNKYPIYINNTFGFIDRGSMDKTEFKGSCKDAIIFLKEKSESSDCNKRWDEDDDVTGCNICTVLPNYEITKKSNIGFFNKTGKVKPKISRDKVEYTTGIPILEVLIDIQHIDTKF